MAHNPPVRLRPPNLQEDVHIKGQSVGDGQAQLETLIESFSALADEVQSLIDRRTILEHKLRYAHEQYQYLADKYAPGAAEISEKLAQLQLPPDSTRAANTNFVPLPKRDRPHSSHHEIAVLIREGRRAARHLNSVTGRPLSGKDNYPITPNTTISNMSTVLWQDFTVEGKKGTLNCPFSAKGNGAQEEDAQNAPAHDNVEHTSDPTPHQSNDPICAAMFEESMSQPAPTNGAAKCPIRFMDQHSPEEIAQYVEKHKHEIPRSHEVCVRRYQKNEDQIKKLDAKYGSLVGMIQDLSHLHQPMLPASQGAQYAVDQASNQRVEAWAQDLVSTDPQDPEMQAEEPKDESDDALEDRESHFDRPFREIRVGESPTRPWGISVPNNHSDEKRQPSPAAPPIRLPHPTQEADAPPPGGSTARKCPFDHAKLGAAFGAPAAAPASTLDPMESEPGHSVDHPEPRGYAAHDVPSTPIKQVQPPPAVQTGPAFISPSNVADKAKPGGPQMLFTGPVFIGYPMEQAIEFMKAMGQSNG